MAQDTLVDNLSLLGDGESYRDELCRLIESAPMFNNLKHADIRILAGFMRAYEAKKGRMIFKEGEKGQFMCIVLSGRVDIIKESPERERKKIAVVRPGKSMGEMSLLDELPYSASAVANEDSTLLMLTKLNFERLSEEYPLLYNVLLRQLARLMSLRLRQTTGVLVDYLSDYN